MIFICENNGYAEFTPLSAHTKIERLAQHAKTYGIPASTVDGNDLFAVRDACSNAVEKCRAGKGPVFVECLTHRMRGHYEGDPAKYRELSQLAEWKKNDPIARVTRVLKSKKVITQQSTASDRRKPASSSKRPPNSPCHLPGLRRAKWTARCTPRHVICRGEKFFAPRRNINR